MKIIILLLSIFFALAPPSDPECTSDWYLIREVSNCSYCKEQEPYGDYSLYVCTVTKSSSAYGEYSSVKFGGICQYDEQEPVPAPELQLFYLPIVTTGCPEGAFLTEGYCTILGVPIVP